MTSFGVEQLQKGALMDCTLASMVGAKMFSKSLHWAVP